MTSCDLTWPEVTRKWRSLTGSRRKWLYKAESSCLWCVRPLPGWGSQEEAVTWQEMTSRVPTWFKVTRMWRHLTGSHLEVSVKARKLESGTFYYLQGYSSQEEAVMWQKVTSHHLTWPKLTRKWRHLTGSHLKVAVEGRKLASFVRLTSYKAVAHIGGSHVTGNHITWPHVTGSDPEVTSFNWKSPESGCRRPKTRVFHAFDFLQGCSSHEEAGAWQEMTSCDLTWPEVTWKLHHLTGSHLKVAVEGRKLASFVRLTSYKAVAHMMRLSRNRKWHHVTSRDRKWPESDVVWP